MTPYDALPQPIPNYSDIRYQWWKRKECSGERLSVYHSASFLPLTVIVRNTSPHSIFNVNVMSDSGALVYLGIVPMIITTLGDKDYIWRDPAYTISSPLPVGRCWFQYSDDGGVTHYTEQVEITDCFDDKIRIEYANGCSNLGIPWALLAPQVFTFWIDRGIGQPVTSTDVKEEDNGKTTVIKEQTTVKKYVLNDLFPPYVVDCFHAMKYMATVLLTDGETNLVAAGKVKEISADYSVSACAPKTTVNVQMDEEWRKQCCDGGELSGCGNENAIEVVGTVHTEADEAIATTYPGQPFLVMVDDGFGPLHDHVGQVATYSVGASAWIFLTPNPGDIYHVGYDWASSDTPNLYDIYYEAVVDPSNPSGMAFIRMDPQPVVTGLTAPMLLITIPYVTPVSSTLNRFARIYVSTDLAPGSGSPVWVGLETDLFASGAIIENDFPGEDIIVRIEYFKYNCPSYGFSKYTAAHTEAITGGDFSDDFSDDFWT